MRINFGSASTLLQQLVNILTPASAGGVGHIEGTGAGNPIAIGGNVPCRSVTITANDDNTSRIAVAVGANPNASNAVGTRVGACLIKAQSLTLDVTNLNAVFIDSAVNGEGITYSYVT